MMGSSSAVDDQDFAAGTARAGGRHTWPIEIFSSFLRPP
jgi:hypothetical protein